MELLAQKVHERVVAPADLVAVGRDGAQLAFGAHLAEVHRQRAQQLLGDEVDGPDVGVQKARDVALKEIGVGDVHAAQSQLHVERGGQALVERGVRLDDAHPATDLRQVIGVDDRPPVVGGAADVGVLEAPRQHVVDQVVDRLRVGGLADGDADRLVALEAHQQELVVAIAEEGGEAAEDAFDVHAAVGPQHLFDDVQQLDHGLLLAVAEGRRPSRRRGTPRSGPRCCRRARAVDGPPEELGEQRPGGRDELLGRAPRRRRGSSRACAREKVEVRGHVGGSVRPAPCTAAQPGTSRRSSTRR